ncbi:MAG: toprim domain-containing protein [Gammaproteobacteria bacterium]|nr:toprim domain-containing protein [Gammaproteobacteria bacterium]
MPRIPPEQLDRLKQDISLQRLVEARGVILKKHGADLIGHCPFHDDREPSLVISPAKNLWHCLGACQTGGSVIDWVMKTEGVSFRHAVELLQADYAPSLAAGSSGTVKRSTAQKLPTTLETHSEDARLLTQVIDYYHATLKQSPDALAYLNKRGIAHADAIKRFKLGYANRTLGYRLPATNRTEGAALRGQLQRLGLYRSSGHEHFSGSLVVPVIDKHGHISEVYGRKINDHLRKGTPKHLYLPGPHAGIWNVAALPASSEIILCESLIDALTFWCAGYRNVTASYGIEGFTADHLAAFKTHRTERVLIAYDRDAAGDTAADKLAQQLNAASIDAYRLQFPQGLDANEYALQSKPADHSLGVVIRSAVWLGQGKPRPVTTEPVSAESTPLLIPEPESKPAAPEPAATPEPVIAPEPESITPLAAKENPASLPADPVPAAVIPPAPTPPIAAEVTDHEIRLTLGDRRYRIRGLAKNLSVDTLKINLLVAGPRLGNTDNALHVDTFDLYQQRPRNAFIQHAAVELGVTEAVIKTDLGHLLLKLEHLQAQQLDAAQTPKDSTVTLSDEQTRAALELLHAPDLLERIQSDFRRCGIVGETTNTLVGYLATLSRKLDHPLAVTIQSTSAAGKSALMDALLAFIPDEERSKYSAMTGQSLFYLGERDLHHKVLAIVEEEGAAQASYALKLLQSEGELTIASTGKDPVTGELKTQDYHVTGPVMILLTTTAIDLDEELLNRCLVLTVDEGRGQTQAIHARQRQQRTLSGLLAQADKQTLLNLHQNAQRLLKPLAVVNPYAQQLSFIDNRTRTRRDHEKYLTLIDSLALLHQHQRPIKTVSHHGQPLRYVEVTLDDIATANRLAHEVLGRTLDELPPQTRKLLGHLVHWVSERCQTLAMKQTDYRFSRRDIRTVTGWSDGQLKIHCRRLTELEYLLVHKGGRGQSIEYELLYDGRDDNQSHLMGLIDVAQLRYDVEKAGQTPQKIAPSQGQDRPKSAPSQGDNIGSPASHDGSFSDFGRNNAEKALFRPSNNNESYRNHKVAAD